MLIWPVIDIKMTIEFLTISDSVRSDGLFPPTETDSDWDSFPDGYIVLCRTFSTGLDSDSDPCMESFLNGYCTHFWDRSPSQGQISVPIPYIWIRGSESESKPVGKPAKYKNLFWNLSLNPSLVVEISHYRYIYTSQFHLAFALAFAFCTYQIFIHVYNF